MKKSRGILFRPELVRAILEGRKTVTRRVVKPSGNGECPYGIPGDQLYVKEALRWEPNFGRALFSDGEPSVVDGWPWARPYLSPIHMPRGAARLWLLVKSAHAQRLLDIDEADAVAEGAVQTSVFGDWTIGGGAYFHTSARDAFVSLWDRINGPRGHSTALNPWVWRIEFARLP